MDRRVHQGDRHQGRATGRAATPSWPTSDRRGRRVAGRRLPHRELAGDGAGRERRPVRRRRQGHAGPGARRSTARPPASGPASRPAPRSSSTTSQAHRPTSCRSRCWISQQPEWKGRWGASPPAPTSRRSSPPCSSSRANRPRRDWLTAMKTNAMVFQGNSAAMKAVNAGQVDGALIYHYYYYGDQAKTGENRGNVGAALLPATRIRAPSSAVSGGGVLEVVARSRRRPSSSSSSSPARPARRCCENGTSFEYPVASGCPAEPGAGAAEGPAGARRSILQAERPQGRRT